MKTQTECHFSVNSTFYLNKSSLNDIKLAIILWW